MGKEREREWVERVREREREEEEQGKQGRSAAAVSPISGGKSFVSPVLTAST